MCVSVGSGLEAFLVLSALNAPDADTYTACDAVAGLLAAPPPALPLSYDQYVRRPCECVCSNSV